MQSTTCYAFRTPLNMYQMIRQLLFDELLYITSKKVRREREKEREIELHGYRSLELQGEAPKVDWECNNEKRRKKTQNHQKLLRSHSI
jgi:hypothetical protein